MDSGTALTTNKDDDLGLIDSDGVCVEVSLEDSGE